MRQFQLSRLPYDQPLQPLPLHPGSGYLPLQQQQQSSHSPSMRQQPVQLPTYRNVMSPIIAHIVTLLLTSGVAVVLISTSPSTTTLNTLISKQSAGGEWLRLPTHLQHPQPYDENFTDH